MWARLCVYLCNRKERDGDALVDGSGMGSCSVDRGPWVGCGIEQALSWLLLLPAMLAHMHALTSPLYLYFNHATLGLTTHSWCK